VQLGDSIASGEGTLYGYTYDTKTKSWTGGDVNTHRLFDVEQLLVARPRSGS
jgi:hypothetical protein